VISAAAAGGRAARACMQDLDGSESFYNMAGPSDRAPSRRRPAATCHPAAVRRPSAKKASTRVGYNWVGTHAPSRNPGDDGARSARTAVPHAPRPWRRAATAFRLCWPRDRQPPHSPRRCRAAGDGDVDRDGHCGGSLRCRDGSRPPAPAGAVAAASQGVVDGLCGRAGVAVQADRQGSAWSGA
jgi:hypothetical protein